MNESGLRKALKRRFNAAGVYSLKLNARFARGVPDWWLSGASRDLWLEAKWLQRVPRELIPARLLSANQLDWLTRRAREGRNVAVIVCSDDGCILVRPDALQQPVPRDQFKSFCRTIKEIAEEIVAIVNGVSENAGVRQTVFSEKENPC